MDISTVGQPITSDPAEPGGYALDGTYIVRSDSRNGNSDIFLYDLVKKAEKAVTNDSANQESPSISGNRIVWLDYRTR